MKVKLSAVAFALVFLTTQAAWSAGYEKAITWQPKAAAQAGAVVGEITGSDALYFNPAGLTTGQSNQTELSLNFSPTFSHFEGQHSSSANAASNGPYTKTKMGFSPVAGFTAAYQLSPKLGLGVGYYVSGGTKSKYENLDYSGISAQYDTLKPTVQTNLAVTEAALGLGYEVAPGLKIGAAWRVIMVNAAFASSSIAGGNLLNLKIDDLKDTRFNAFKVGAQYMSPEKTWGIGTQFRSPVKFIAKGEGSGFAETLAPGVGILTTGGGKVDVANEFPLQFVLGGFSKVSSNTKIALEYSFTNYSKNEKVDLSGTLSGGTAPAPFNPFSLNTRDIPQNWKNMHVGRIGYECTGHAMPIRAGYALTTQTTPKDRARATFSSPGLGHSITAGSGLNFSENAEFNFAGEYSFASGKGTNAADGVAVEKEFKSNAWVAHLGVAYKF